MSETTTLRSFMMPLTYIIGLVVPKNGSRRWHLHLVAPALGFVIIGYVLINADARAKEGGIIWLIIGVALLVFYRLTGRGTDLSMEE